MFPSAYHGVVKLDRVLFGWLSSGSTLERYATGHNLTLNFKEDGRKVPMTEVVVIFNGFPMARQDPLDLHAVIQLVYTISILFIAYCFVFLLVTSPEEWKVEYTKVFKQEIFYANLCCHQTLRSPGNSNRSAKYIDNHGILSRLRSSKSVVTIIPSLGSCTSSDELAPAVLITVALGMPLLSWVV